MNLVFEARDFEIEKLFNRIENEGEVPIEDILFTYANDSFEENIESKEKNIPPKVIKDTKGNMNLCMFVNRGYGAGDGILENVSPTYSILMYDRRKLIPFIELQLQKCDDESLDNTRTYYAKNRYQLEDALIGVIRFI